MPYKKVFPVPEDEMEIEPAPEYLMRRQRYEGHNTICQKLRELYAAIDDPALKLKCRIATAMAKKMHEKLKAYRDRYDQEAQNG